MGTTINKPTVTQPGFKAVKVHARWRGCCGLCHGLMFQLSLRFQDAFYWHSLFLLRRGRLWPAKVSRKGWRTRCARRKCKVKSSNVFRSQRRIVSTVHSPQLGQGHTGASYQQCCSDAAWLSLAEQWGQSSPSLFLAPAAGCDHRKEKFSHSCGLILLSLFPFSAYFQYFQTIYGNSIFFCCESSGYTEYTEIGLLKKPHLLWSCSQIWRVA